MSTITKRTKDRRRKVAVTALRELATRIETGQLIVISQGMWKGATSDKWNFHLEMQENPVPVLSETLSGN